MSGFLDAVIFPSHISRESLGGPDWPAQISRLASGFEERITPWSSPLRTYDAKWGVRSADELYEILQLYHAVRGRLYGFRYLDWSDYKSCLPSAAPAAADQVLGTGDGTTDSFQLMKTYSVGGAPDFVRNITKPFDTVLIAVDGTPTASGWSLDAATGIVTFDAPPALDVALTWGGVFHVPVRFDCKLDQITLRGPIGDIPSIYLQELRL
ncbi:MAG: DUF2460 domain-containing protein [Paracoccaceae bacterium]